MKHGTSHSAGEYDHERRAEITSFMRQALPFRVLHTLDGNILKNREAHRNLQDYCEPLPLFLVRSFRALMETHIVLPGKAVDLACIEIDQKEEGFGTRNLQVMKWWVRENNLRKKIGDRMGFLYEESAEWLMLTHRRFFSSLLDEKHAQLFEIPHSTARKPPIKE